MSEHEYNQEGAGDNEPETALEARNQADEAQAAAAAADTAAESAKENFNANKPSLDAAVTEAQAAREEAEETLDAAITARETARAARDEAYGDAEAAKETATTARDDLNDAVINANGLIEDANSAAAALVKAIEDRNELQLTVNEAIEAVITATNNGEPAADISALRSVAVSAQALLDVFDADIDLDALEQLRESTDQAAQEAIGEVDTAQEAFDAAMIAVQKAIDHLNTMETDLFQAQTDELAATSDVNEAIAALNVALEALHDAELELTEAVEYALHMQEVADIKEANALAWEQYDADMLDYEAALAEFEAEHAVWLLGFDADDPEYLEALAQWKLEMEARGIAEEDYLEALAAFRAAQSAHNTAMEEFRTREAEHEIALKEWEDFIESIGSGGPNTVVRTNNVKELPGMGSSLNGNFNEEIAPGVTLYRNTNDNTFGLIVSEDAQQGTIVLQLKSGNSFSHFTISINQAGTFTNFNLGVSQSESSGFGIVARTFMDKPVFGENPPVFNEYPPDPLDQGPPPPQPEARGEEPVEPDKPELRLDDIPEFVFSGTPFEGEDSLTPPEIPDESVEHDPFDLMPMLTIVDLNALEGEAAPGIIDPDGELPDEPVEEDDDDDDEPIDDDDDDDEPIDDEPADDEPADDEPVDEYPVDGPGSGDPVVAAAITAPPEPVPADATAPAPADVPATAPAPADAPADAPAVFEIPDTAAPLTASPVPDDYQSLTIIEDPAVPLAMPADLGEVAGFLTTGLVLATLIAAVVGNSIRKMRTEEVEEEQEI